MSMKIIKYIAPLLLLSLLITACAREIWPSDGVEYEGWVIPFSATPSMDVVVSTKGTMTDSKSENIVHNIYLMIFDSSGSKVYGGFFRQSDRGSGENQWDYTPNTTTMSSGTIHVKSTKSSESLSSNCTIVGICNLNAEMVNITREQLDNIGSLETLKAVSAELLQLITSRSGYFPMCGVLKGVSLYGGESNNKIVFSPTEGSTLKFTRLDARVEFKVKAEQNCGIYDFTPLTWQVINLPRYAAVHPEGTVVIPTGKTIDDLYFDGGVTNFETQTIIDSDVKYDSESGQGTGAPIPVHGFSFYMMENKQKPRLNDETTGALIWDETTKKHYDESREDPLYDWTYSDRDLQVKTAEGLNKLNSKKLPVFKYADDYATYVILKGQLVLEKEGHTNHAEVQYIIHLGDFGDSGVNGTHDFTNFTIERNHKYTYEITIRGVDNIRAEVSSTTGEEIDPGASGQIVVPVKQIFTCDSHYSTHALEFTKAEVLSGNLGWWVRTPFNKDGISSNDNGGLPGGDIDYKWVEFRVNFDKKKSGLYIDHAWTDYQPHGDTAVPSTNYKYIVDPTLDGNPYQNKATLQPTTPTLYINELMDFLTVAANGTDSNVKFDDNDRIVVTAFVNEYYYEKDPFKEEYDVEDTKELWRKFVNQPMRTMCIGVNNTNSGYSVDKESRVEEASYIIQQYSIQSVYNVNHYDDNFHNAWGVEYFTDEVEDDCVKYVKSGSTNRHNDNPDNGRYDTMIEWDLGLWGSDKTWTSGETYVFDDRPAQLKSWSTYLSSDWNTSWTKSNNTSYPYIEAKTAYVNYEPPFLKADYQYLRYTCLSRNRDNNGNGKIDQEEVRWYMAASNQLINLFLGSYGIDGPAGLYQRSAVQRASEEREDWRQHVLGSDRNTARNNSNSDGHARLVWAEQGLNGSDISYKHDTQTSSFSTRCVRNLGYDPSGVESRGKDITYSSESVAPDPVIIVTQKTTSGGSYDGDWGTTDGAAYKDVYLYVDCRRMNEHSLRYYTDRELAPHDEFSEASCLYKVFETTSINESIHWAKQGETDPALKKSVTGETMNENVDKGTNPYCPTGYRLPNMRELGVICYYLDKTARDRYVREGTTNNMFIFARTTYSFGKKGTNPKAAASKEWGWGITFDKVLMADGSQSTNTTRCVRDIKQ